MAFLEELHSICIDSDDDMFDLIGGFPDGLIKIGSEVEYIKGRKTKEGTSIG